MTIYNKYKFLSKIFKLFVLKMHSALEHENIQFADANIFTAISASGSHKSPNNQKRNKDYDIDTIFSALCA